MRAVTPTVETASLRIAPWRSARAWLRRALAPALLLIFVLAFVPSDGHLGAGQVDLAVKRAIRGQGLRLASWEAQAIGQKASAALSRPGASLPAAQQKQLVLDYFAAVRQIDDLDGEVQGIFAANRAAEAGTLAAPLQARLDALRGEQEARRPAVERIIEQQVGAVLREAGLVPRSLVWPPVRFQFTESPLYLILSPRERIRVERGAYLEPTLAVDEQERVEGELAAALDRSVLVEGTGGFSSYPTMVLDYPELEWVVDTVAHEWAHTNLTFRPLGMHYFGEGGMRTINETVASIVGEEISRRVVERFYPERVKPAAWPRPLSLRRDWLGDRPEAAGFEYGPFMRRTRLEVDRLLGEGKVAEAEAYMEAQRQELVRQGYHIRKLNQAFFAFHGSYAVGEAATDPIGARLRALRERSASLAQFYRTVAGFDDASDLAAALAGSSFPAAGAAGSAPAGP